MWKKQHRVTRLRIKNERHAPTYRVTIPTSRTSISPPAMDLQMIGLSNSFIQLRKK